MYRCNFLKSGDLTNVRPRGMRALQEQKSKIFAKITFPQKKTLIEPPAVIMFKDFRNPNDFPNKPF